jgi:hypothetical protein
MSLAILLLAALPIAAREKDGIQYGTGLSVNVPFPEAEVAQVVQDVVQNGIIRGTKEYNSDEYINGAVPAASTKVFPQWTEGGKVFYKVRSKAIDPRNFKDSNDVGTLAVRYILQPQGDKNTVIRIDALYVEDFRRTVHQSNGSVEGAEYKDIHDRLESIEVMKEQTAEAEKEKAVYGSKQQATTPTPNSQDFSSSSAVSTPGSAGGPPASTADVAQGPPQTLEEHIRDLRSKVERLVKAPGAPLKSAPFHTASTLQSLPPGTEVLIVISTPYWLGVETHEGQHGWMLRDDLEQAP